MLAMAPPVTLGGKLIIALLMFILGGFFYFLVRGPFTKTSLCIAILGSIILLISFEIFFPKSFLFAFHDRGFIAAIIGLISSLFFLRPTRKRNAPQPHHPFRMLRLFVFSLICGPFLGLIFALIVVLFFEENIYDWDFPFIIFIFIGFIASFFFAFFLALFAWLSKNENGPGIS